jgi:hypothetical protein
VKTGIHPFNPLIILDQIAPIILDDEEDKDDIITSAREVRKLVKWVK